MSSCYLFHEFVSKCCNCFHSYKEESDEVTDSDDLLEVEMNEVDQEKESAETIEKVIRRRVARKGGQVKLTFTSRHGNSLVEIRSITSVAPL